MNNISQPLGQSRAKPPTPHYKGLPCEIIHLILANLNLHELSPLLSDKVLGPIAAAVYFRHVTIAQNGNCMEPADSLVFSPEAFCDFYAASPVPIQTLTVSDPLIYDQLCAILGSVFAQSVQEVRYDVTNLWDFRPSETPFWQKVCHVTYTGFTQKVHRDFLEAAVAYLPSLKTLDVSPEALDSFKMPNCVSLRVSGWRNACTISQLELDLQSETGPCDLRDCAGLQKVTIRGRNAVPQVLLPKCVHSLVLHSVHFTPKAGFAVSRFAANNCKLDFPDGIMDWTSWPNLDELLVYGGRSVHPKCGNRVIMKTVRKLRFLQLDTDFVDDEEEKVSYITLPEVNCLDITASDPYFFDVGIPLTLYAKTPSLPVLPSTLSVLSLRRGCLEGKHDFSSLDRLVQLDVS